MNANFGLVDDLPNPIKDKKLKREKIADRALTELREWSRTLELAAAP
jgi:methylenetetrahydrofolate--tRNA-(uracil-5-)-methyltransferase